MFSLLRSAKYFLALVLISAPAFAQIPNQSFESWQNDAPISWVAGNGNGIVAVTPSLESRTGTYAAHIKASAVMGILIPGVLVSAEDQNGFPVSQKYQQMTFHYKFKPTVPTAYLFVAVDFAKGEQGIAGGIAALKGETDGYVSVTIPIMYITDVMPDRAVITFMVTDEQQNSGAAESFAVIDDITFDAVTGVEDEASAIKSFKLEQNYPNPFNPATKISYTVPANLKAGENVTLKVYNVIGKEVATLVNEQKAAGEYTAEFSAANLPSGVYMYRFQAGSFVETRKMTLLK